MHLKINKQELYKLYMQEVNNIADECDWVTHFTSEECVNIVSNILEKNTHLVTYSEVEQNIPWPKALGEILKEAGIGITIDEEARQRKFEDGIRYIQG